MGLSIFISITNSQAQDVSGFEARIASLLEKSYGYESTEKILNLIRWESDIPKSLPSISPLEVPDFRNISISSGYGARIHPITHEHKHHSGIDMPAKIGDPVYASGNGRVLQAGEDRFIGKYIRIQHAYGFESIYGHLSRQFVQTGDSVRIGSIIGAVGNSGRSTGPHLHYGIKKNGAEENAYPYCFLLIKIMLQSQRKETEP